MFGIPLDGPTSVYCDNNSVVTNTTRCESTLKKKHLAIACHRCHEAHDADYVRSGLVPGEHNHADLLTVPHCSGGNVTHARRHNSR